MYKQKWIKVSCFHKLSRITYQNKLKTAYEHAINCFHKLSQTVLEVFLPVDKLKCQSKHVPKLIKGVVGFGIFHSSIIYFQVIE